MTTKSNLRIRASLWCLMAVVPAPAMVIAGSPVSLKVESLDIRTSSGVHHFSVEVADTAATRERGLMFRKSMAADRGMLFDFKTSQPVAFWMKDTLIPLDMLFIGADGRIVSIARNAVPMSESPIPSGAPVLDVLELRGGRAAEIEAEPGDKVWEKRLPR